MARPINLSLRHEYVLKCEAELPVDQRTTWIFKPLSSVDQIILQDLLRETPERLADPTRWVLDYLRRTLVGWRNFPTGKNPDEKDEPFVTSRADGLPTDATLGLVPVAHFAELFQAAKDAQPKLDPEQRGKS